MTVVLTVVDRFSKFARYLPLPKLPTAKETAELLVSVVFAVHGLPLDIVSDRGPQFTSAVWKSFCRAIGATVSLTSGFHPQANGQAERANQKLETTLRCLASSNPTSWTSQLPWVEYAHNTLPTAATGLSPFQCVYGFQPPLFPSQERELASLLSRTLHPPGLLMAIRRSRFTRFWTPVPGGAACSISSTGRAMDQRRGAGFPGSGFWMPLSYGRSIAFTLRSLEDRPGGARKGGGGGVLSRTPGRDSGFLAALRLLVGVVSSVPVYSPEAHHLYQAHLFHIMQSTHL